MVSFVMPQPAESRFLWTICFSVIPLFLLVFQGDLPLAADALAYEVRWEGLEDRSIRADLESVSDTLKWKEKPPASLGLLRRRAEGDVEQFQKVLRSAGYYGAEISFEVSEENDDSVVTFDIRTGEVFRLESVEWTADDRYKKILKRLPAPEELGLRKGEPARARAILDAEKALVQALKKKGRPFAAVEDRKVVVDHRTRTVRVTFHLAPGPLARFGAATITGLKTIEESFVRNRLLWKQGERWNADLITETQRELTQSALFTLVRISHADSLDSAGELPLTVDVSEGRHRSVKIGAGYKTDEGPGGKFSWEHRNLFHHGEKLQLSATGSAISTAFDASFSKPDFLTPNQSLLLASRLANDDTDAYKSRYLDSGVTLERKVGKTIKWSAGPAFRWSRVEQQDETDEFALISLQSHFDWDRSDNLLDPTRGGRLKVQLAPYVDTLGTSLAFTRSSVSYSHYFTLMEKPRMVFAARAGLGSLVGAERDAVPADLRFYAGGGGSIRGYPYQTVGPLQEDEPVGGRSLFEVNTELRMRVTRNVGLVAFIDGGSAFEAVVPDFSEDILWGAGLGFRYHTPIGPLRLDFAVPLQRRDGIDEWFQAYVSIGQAF
jgi:translocation and assembly module TamA